MAEIDHHLRWQARFFQPDFHFCHMFCAVVRLFAAAQNDVAVAVTAGVNDGRVAPFGHRQEAVRRAGGVDGVDSHLDGAVSAVFEAHRTRETGRQLAVNLRFSSAGTNRAPSSSGLPGIAA